MPEAGDYRTGDVKRSPDGLAVAIRMDDATFGVPSGAWGIMHVKSAGGFLPYEHVADWADLS